MTVAVATARANAVKEALLAEAQKERQRNVAMPPPAPHPPLQPRRRSHTSVPTEMYPPLRPAHSESGHVAAVLPKHNRSPHGNAPSEGQRRASAASARTHPSVDEERIGIPYPPEDRLLPPNYVVKPSDIVCGDHSGLHPGNMYLQKVLCDAVESYYVLSAKERNAFVNKLISEYATTSSGLFVHKASNDGDFESTASGLKRNKPSWIQLSHTNASKRISKKLIELGKSGAWIAESSSGSHGGRSDHERTSLVRAAAQQEQQQHAREQQQRDVLAAGALIADDVGLSTVIRSTTALLPKTLMDRKQGSV
eukprot:CAMPEP_0194039722 /NCGR_PEP_ID=MMETSP0009_2-20130614/11840_1 /TAXON_ID=210454 /ORGANISM="Grammatophora oceanica, Strain CCMP 410" /LENGTH=308 /DNA_ID=CAMNT_0038682653 /DNA_START=45 /DNA_END=972 /DNA_ORIENTATION=-